jgi:hypothetical protein
VQTFTCAAHKYFILSIQPGLNAKVILEQRTGISVKASHVRLLTSKDDAYSWKYLPKVEHLSLKTLSDHSVGAYRELCAGIGQTFEAIPSFSMCQSDNGLPLK